MPTVEVAVKPEFTGPNGEHNLRYMAEVVGNIGVLQPGKFTNALDGAADLMQQMTGRAVSVSV